MALPALCLTFSIFYHFLSYFGASVTGYYPSTLDIACKQLRSSRCPVDNRTIYCAKETKGYGWWWYKYIRKGTVWPLAGKKILGFWHLDTDWIPTGDLPRVSGLHHIHTIDWDVLPGQTSIEFQVRHAPVIYLFLYQTVGDSTNPIYNFRITKMTRRMLSIQLCKLGKPVKLAYHRHVTKDGLRSLWVSWKNGVVKVGSRDRVKKITFMKWEDSKQYRIDGIEGLCL